MRDEVVVKLAELEDVERIAEITYQHEPKEGYIKAFTAQVEANEEKDSIAYIFVAKIRDEIVGHGKLFYYDPDKLDVKYPSPEGWYFNGIIVDENYRRKGVAKALSGFRENFIKTKSNSSAVFSIVSAENIPSIKYHESLNFKEYQRAEGFLNIKLDCGEGILFSKKIPN